MEVVKLRNGTEEAKPLVATVMMSINRLPITLIAYKRRRDAWLNSVIRAHGVGLLPYARWFSGYLTGFS